MYRTVSSFTFIKRLFSSSFLSAVRVISSAYLRLLIFLPTILIPAYISSTPAFHMMYIAYKLNKQRHYFADKGPSSQSYCFSSNHVWMWELDHKESWLLKNWCFWTVVLEETLESSLNCKEIQPVKSQGNQSWIFIGRTDAEAETPTLWPPDVKNWLNRKDPDSGKDWR